MRLIYFVILSFMLPNLAVSQEAPQLGKSGAPIVIESNKLEVLQSANKAIFSGQVVATQGEMKLRSDVMDVYYASESGNDGSGIDRIEVEGNVVLATAAESARAESGKYDAQTNMLTLHGSVVLTQGDNVLRGGHLSYDMNTGKSILSAGKATKTNSGRVQGIFKPKQ